MNWLGITVADYILFVLSLFTRYQLLFYPKKNIESTQIRFFLIKQSFKDVRNSIIRDDNMPLNIQRCSAKYTIFVLETCLNQPTKQTNKKNLFSYLTT